MRYCRFILFSFALFVICHNTAKAQAGNIKPGADTAAINRLMNHPYRLLSLDSTIIFYDSILKLCIAANYADGAFRILIAQSIKYYEKENYAGERDCSIRALPWAARSTIRDATAWCYNNIGDSYFSEGDYIEASENYYKSLEELRKVTAQPTHITANDYNYLGLINIRLGQPAKGLAYFKQAEDISRKWGLDFQLGNTLTYKGEYYNSIYEADSAIKCFDEVMQIGKKMGKMDLQAFANDDLGKTFIVKGEYREAIPLLQMAISISKNVYPYIVADASYSLGDALCHTGKYKEAESILLAALSETKAHNYKDNYINCYSKLMDVYKATGDYKKALAYTDSLMVLKDSLAGAEKAKAINQMEIKYETAEKDKQLAQNELLIAQQKNKIVRENILIASIAGSIFLLVLLLAGLTMRARNKQRLQAEQIKSLQQENTISMLKGVVQGEEKERGRIARELHDGIGGMLSAAMMRIMSIRHEKEDIVGMPAYSEAMQLLNEMGDEIRKTAHNLMPEVLLKQSLPEAIRTYCNYARESNALQIDFQSYGSFDKITQTNKLNIYRIVQELLKNIMQHAHASHTLVQLLINAELLTITVEDNGVGFNIGDTQHGIGLQSLQTRVGSMGGHYTLDSEPGKGTSVYIEFEMRKMIAHE